MTIKFNVEPYYDDFETATPAVDGLTPKEKYNKILFRPGHAVQARELTQLQSILQNQVTQVSNNLFKEGSMIIPGHTTVESSIDYVLLDTINATDMTQLKGLTFTDGHATSPLLARVVHAEAADGLELVTLYVKYTNTGLAGKSVYTASDSITASSFTATVAAVAPTGFGSIASVDDGIYFIKGHMVVVKSDTVILDKYTADPSYDIGLEISESVQTSAGDASLNDNANGTPNYAAPGAHRYQISTKLVKQVVAVTATDNFLLLLRIEAGNITKQVRATEYAVIEETMARRTFDESGNYSVRPFLMDINEHTDVNIVGGDESKISLGMEPSKAYVRGYEVETLSTTQIATNKARESTLFEAASVPTPIGNYVVINSMTGLPFITDYQRISLKNSGSTIIGFARPRTIVHNGSGVYNLYLFDIEMNPGSVFDDVRTLYTAGSLPFNASVVLDSGKAIIKDPGRNTLVFETPFNRVKTCDSSADNDPDDFNYVYHCTRLIGADTVASGDAVFTTVGTAEQFEPLDTENWILAAADGTIITISSVTIASGSQSVTISGLGSHDGTNVTLIAGVKRSLNHKVKSLTTGGSHNVNQFSVSSPVADMQLDRPDGYRLLNVYMSDSMGTGATVSDEDVAEYYDFDNGQRDNFYALSRIKLKPTTAFVPTGQLLIKYEFFTHTGSGDFFTVDSYDNLVDFSGNAVRYEDIPNYTSKSLGKTLELRSSIDFRPRESNAGENFTGTGAHLTVCPEPQTTFTTDIQYYLNRIDKVFIDKDGIFGVVEGVSALEPVLPEDPKDAMVLYNVYMAAYTEGPKEVIPTMIDNKRYTMRDIGRIDKRVNNLEYYTALSLLEKDADGRQIIDSGTGVQRVKSGFIVDSFATHSVGDVTNPEYRSAIDRQAHNLRPQFASDNVSMKYSSVLSTGVQKTGDLITLPYTEVSLANQDQASAWMNVNPYDVFSWVGNIELSPSSDEWKDSTQRPNLVIDQEGVYDAMMGIINETNSLGTVWNEWQTNWTGAVSRNSSDTRSGRKITTTTVSSWKTGESRTGIETYVTPDTITTNIGDRVVEVNFAPFIRSRIINFKATRLKANTQMYAFFDGVDVSAYVRTEATFTLSSDNNNPVLSGKNTVTAHPVTASTLTTNDNGELIGSFFIPNNSTKSFKTGSRLFKLTDSSTNAVSTTSAEENYNAKGLIETKENVTISTRVPLIERREVPGGNRIVPNSSSDITGVRWVDPLAQSFMIDTSGGAFLTSMDLFFHTKDTSETVTLQIREMNQGIPTQRILPFSEVTLNPSSVNVVDLDTVNPSPALATNFAFSSPVYLQENQEYCFVILANSNKYNVWYAGIGDNNYITGRRISKQPYTGVLFKSQNASTWSPDQNKDIKFKINRAEFDTSADGQVVLNNGTVATRKLVKHAITSTSGSKIITVEHPNHHFFNTTNSIASKVTISGAVNFNGLTTVNGTHTVYDVEMDRYKINLSASSNASGTGIGGGADIVATQNQMINTFMPYVQGINFGGTNATWAVKLATGMTLGATTPTPYVLDSAYSPIIVNQNFSVNKPMVIASVDNKSGDSILIRGLLTSTKSNISPVIDLERCSLITIANRIDNPEIFAGTDTTKNNVEGFVAETAATGGSAKSKYVTKSVTLGSASDGLHVFVDTNRPSQTHIDVYYKVAASEDVLDAALWVLASPLEAIPYTDSSLFNESEYVIDPAGTFSAFKLKIVLRSSNSSRIPMCKDLRVIAILP